MKKPSATLNTDPLLKIGEAAKILGVSIDTLRRWEKSGRINTVKTPAGTRFYSLKALRAINPDLEHTNQIVNPSAKPEPLTTEELLREIKEEGKELVQIKSKYPTPKPSSLYSTFPQSTVFNPPSSIVNSDSIGVKILLSHFFPVAILALALPVLLFSFLINPKITQQFGLNIANDSSVLAATAGSAFLEVNTDVQISGSLWVSDLINDLKIEATPSANTLALSSGTTSLTVTKSATLDQDVSTASSPTFATPTVAGLNLSAAKDQLVFQSGGPSGTLTWTPSSVQVITLPNATGTVLLDSATQTITNKTISGSSNTITNLPNSALANKKVTVTAGTNLTGGGDVELGSSVTLALKDSPSISGTLTVAGATTLSSTLAVTGATTLSSTLTAGSSTLSSLSVTGATTLTGAATLSSTLDVTGNVGVGGTATFSNPLIVNSQIKITGGSPGTNKVLTSDSNGLATWTSVTAAGGVSGSGTQNYVPKFDSSSSITNSLIYDDGTNIGIGTASPGSKFTVIGNIGIGTSAAGAALQVNGGGLFGWGTALTSLSSGSIAGFNGNVGIGTTSPRMPLEVWGNGTNTATFLNGNVGIGTTVPGEKLEVNGGIIRVDNSVNPGIDFYVSGGQESIIRAASGADEIITGSATGDLTIRTTTNNILFSTNNGSSAQMYINTSGNVGIGTTVPTTELEIGGTISPTLRMNPSDNSGAAIQLERYNSSGNYFNIESGAGNRATLELYYTGTTGFTLDTSGNVGIGTSSPRMPLEVWGNGTNAATFLNGNVGIGFTSPDRITQIASDIDITGSLSSLLGAGGTQFAITGSTGTTLQKKLTLGLDTTNNYGVIQAGNTSGTAYNLALQPGGGNVGIGITSPTAPLEVFGAGSLESTTVIRVTVSGDVFPGYNMQRKNAVTKTNAGWGMYIGSAGDFQIQDETNDAYKNVFRLEPGSINNLIYGVGGNLGIGGISTPVGLLDVNRKLNVLSNGNVGIGNTSPSQVFQVNADTSNPFVVTSGGNVGIGTTSPVYPLHMVSSTQYSVFINMKNTYGGGDSQLNLYADQGASWIYPNNKDLILSHDGSAKVLTIKSSGNVGIGTTVAGAALQVNGGGLFGWGTALTSLSSGSIAGFNGNVGVGTTSPLANLHVVGQCVAKGTRIRRRRRKSTSDGGDEGDSSEVDWEEDEIPVEDIKPGDEVSSLNDKTGEFEWRKVEKTMDMGIQQVFGIKTSGGKYIKTTANHPYLVQIKPPKIISGVFEVDLSNRIENINKSTFIALANQETTYTIKLSTKTKQILKPLHQKRHISKFGFQIYAHLIRQMIKLSGFRIDKLIIDHDYSGNEEEINAIIKQVYPELPVEFKSIGHGSPADRNAHTASAKGVGINKTITAEEFLAGKTTKKETQFALKGATEATDHQGCLPGFPLHRVSKEDYHNLCKLSMGESRWIKVGQLNIGDKIATAAGWEHVIDIEELDRMQTYDLQIENTHNFVGNGIVAHNTYITSGLNIGADFTASGIASPANGLAVSGNVGIGTTSPSQIFQVNANTANPFVVTSGGNVGIGTTAPSSKLNVEFGTITANGASGLRLNGILNTSGVYDYSYGFYNTVTTTVANAGGNRANYTILTDIGSGANSNWATHSEVVLNKPVNQGATAFGVFGIAKTLGTVDYTDTADGITGVYGRIRHDGSGTLTTAQALRASMVNGLAGGTITSLYGLNINDLSNTGGTITNTYGVYIGDLTAGTQTNTPFSIYSSDTNTYNYFAGNVGIGTTDPGSYKLNVQGSTTQALIKSNSNNPASLQFLNNTGNGIVGVESDTGGGIATGTIPFAFVLTTGNASTPIQIGPNYSVAMTIRNGGNVGIGTTNPSAIFAVGTGATSNFTVTSTGNLGIGGTATFNNPAIFNSNVGIGTSIPVAPLTIKSAGNDDSTFALRIYNSSNTELFHIRDNGYAVIGSGSYLSSIPLEVSNSPYTHGDAAVQIGVLDTRAIAQGVGGGIGFMGKVNSSAYGFYGAIKGYKANATADDYSGQLHFQTRKNNEASKTRMVIDENGNVGIGTSAPISPTSRLSILGGNVGIGTSAAGASLAVNGNGVIGWGTALVAGPSNGLAVSGNVGIGTTTPSQALDVIGNARFRSVGSGTYANDLNLTADGTLTTLTSDITMKTNLETISGALDKLMQLKPYTFNWIDDPNGPRNLGLVAQEVAQTLPEITFTNQTDGKMGINYSKFAPLLIAAIQEQQANIGNLTTQVTQLGSQLTGLSDKVTTNNVKTLSLDLGSGTIASTSAGLAINLTPGADFQISNDTNSVLLNITASGNVGIGTSNPQAALDVKASGPGIIARFNSDNSTGCTLSDTGTISCTSDKNLKKNIEDLNYGLGTLMELKPVSFNWNSQDDSSTKNLGFIAQDVENIIPNLVSTDPKTGVKQLNTIGLIPVLVKSVQQQQTAINDLIASEATASAILSHFKVDSFGNVGIGSSASGLKVDRLILSASDTKSSSLSSDGSNLIYIDKDNAISNVLTTSTPAYFDLNSRVASVESKGNTLEERIKSLEDRLAQLATAQVAGVATESGQLSGLSSQSSATSSSVISQPVNRQQTNQILTTENRTPITNISTSSAQITPEATASALVATPSASVIPSRAPGGEEESFASISTSSGKIASSSSTPRNDISKLDLTPPDILFATASTQVADLKVTSDATVSGQLTAYEATIQETFKALGKTFLSKTTIAGDLTVNGGMSITQDSINTIGILHIQNSALAKGVDFLNGLVKIDGSGAVWVQKLAVSKKTLGTDIIPAEQTDVAIVTDAITNKSKVFITAQSSTSGKSLFVSYQEPSLGFIVSLDSAMEIDVKFNWFLVDQSD